MSEQIQPDAPVLAHTTHQVAVSARERQEAATQQVTDEQGIRLAELIRQWKPLAVHVTVGPFDLPPGYLLVVLKLRTTDYVLGMDTDGNCSS